MNKFLVYRIEICTVHCETAAHSFVILWMLDRIYLNCCGDFKQTDLNREYLENTGICCVSMECGNVLKGCHREICSQI